MMPTGPADLKVLSAIVWVVLVVLFLSLGVIVFLSSRAFEIAVGFRIRSDRTSSRTLLRAAFMAAGLMIVALFCLEITAGETIAVRLAVVGIALIVVWLGVRLAWTKMEDDVRRRSTQTLYWRRRSDEIDNTLRSLDSSAAIRRYAAETLISELELTACSFEDEIATPIEFPRLLVRCRIAPVLQLNLGEREDGRAFTNPQRRFAESVADSVARALDHAAHIGALVQTTRNAEREEQSRQVLIKARGFLAPPEKPEVPGLEYAWDRWRGNHVGTAMFDLMALPNRSLGIVLAEAEGTDLEAAIQLVQLQALLRSRIWAYADDLRELLESTERALAAARTERGPIRIFCARYFPETRTVRYVNAGFYAPMILRVHETGADVLRLASKHGALCEKNRADLQEDDVVLQPADLLAIATPGLAAARNPGLEPWSESRLADTLLSWEPQPVQDIARLTLRTVEEFTGKDAGAPERVLILLRLQGARSAQSSPAATAS